MASVLKSETGHRFFPNDGLTEEIARRLSTYRCARLSNENAPLRRDFHRREEYKRVGAVYNGEEKQWSMPAGHDLRRILDAHPDWIEEPDVVTRCILLHLIISLDDGSLLR